jgi:hypothetical protein
MNHRELDNLQTILNNALNKLRIAMDRSMLPPLSSQYGNEMHPLDGLDRPTPVGVYEARRAALGMFECNRINPRTNSALLASVVSCPARSSCEMYEFIYSGRAQESSTTSLRESC